MVKWKLAVIILPRWTCAVWALSVVGCSVSDLEEITNRFASSPLPRGQRKLFSWTKAIQKFSLSPRDSWKFLHLFFSIGFRLIVFFFSSLRGDEKSFRLLFARNVCVVIKARRGSSISFGFAVIGRNLSARYRTKRHDTIPLRINFPLQKKFWLVSMCGEECACVYLFGFGGAEEWRGEKWSQKCCKAWFEYNCSLSMGKCSRVQNY